MLRKESNLVDKPQRIAKGDMASSVAVKKGGFAEAIKSSALDFSNSPYHQPVFPPAIQPRQLSSSGGARLDKVVLERAKSYSNPNTEFSRTAPGGLVGISSEDRTESMSDSNGLNRSSSLSNMALMNGSEATGLIPGAVEAWASPAPAKHESVSHGPKLIHKFDPIANSIKDFGSSEQLDLDGDEDGQEYPGSTAVAMGLLRIADNLCRKLLPWQAVCCPCAVETFRDIRSQSLLNQNRAFVQKMTAQLEKKVADFIAKKDEEVDRWLQREADFWAKAIDADNAGQDEFVVKEEMRILERAALQDKASKMREEKMALTIDMQEREAAKEQLNNYRRLCRSDKLSSSSTDVRSLYTAMESAQTLLVSQKKSLIRDLAKRQEQAVGWLCCLGDNALAAVVCEEGMQSLTSGLQEERARALDSLQAAIGAYTQQHNAILEAIDAFAGKVHQHSQDFSRREQLIAIAYREYLVSIVSNGILPNLAEDKKKKLAWEGKLIVDRATKHQSGNLGSFQAALAPFEKMVSQLKEKLLLQLEQVTMKMQSILNTRDKDINARKAAIFKRLSKHVKKVCNNRRLQVKTKDAARLEAYRLEEKCIKAIDEMSTEVRSGMDQLWVKEHLRERRMYDAAVGRTARLESAALLLWKKNSHLATKEKEDYELWFDTFVKLRNNTMDKRHTLFTKSYELFRSRLMSRNEIRGIDVLFREKMTEFVRYARKYRREDTADQTEQKTIEYTGEVNSWLTGVLEGYRKRCHQYIEDEKLAASKFYGDLRSELLQDWQENLKRLNRAVVRRIKNLKVMETELQDTLKLAFAQNEVECIVFEQTSCAKFEHFWSAWGDRLDSLAKELRNTTDDFEAAQARKRMLDKSNKKDAAIDILVAGGPNQGENARKARKFDNAYELSPEKRYKKGYEGGGGSSTLPSLVKTVSEFDPNKDSKLVNNIGAEDILNMSNLMRLKVFLEELHPNVFIDFRRYIAKQCEQSRKTFGEGRKKLVPAYFCVRAIFTAAEKFWSNATISELFLQRKDQGYGRVFDTALPTNARSIFSVALAMSMLHDADILIESFEPLDTNDTNYESSAIETPIEEVTQDSSNAVSTGKVRINTDEFLTLMERGTKKHFLAAFLVVTSPIIPETFGETSLFAECVWICTACNVNPPRGLLARQGGSAMYREEETRYSAFPDGDPVTKEVMERFVPDSVEIINGILNISTEPVKRDIYNRPTPVKDLEESGADCRTIYSFLRSTDDTLPILDIGLLAAFLSRPEWKIDVTSHRLSQVTYFWRLTTRAILQICSHSPGPEYPSLIDIMNIHYVASIPKKNVSVSDVVCISPFDNITSYVQWLTTIKGLPLSVLQALSIIARGGSCDPYLEDNKLCATFRINRLQKAIYEMLDLINIMDIKADDTVLSSKKIFRGALVDADGSTLPSKVILPPDLEERLRSFDVGGGGKHAELPLEMIRNYMQKEDQELNNAQLSEVLWCLNRRRTNDEMVANCKVEVLLEEDDQSTELLIPEAKKEAELLPGAQLEEQSSQTVILTEQQKALMLKPVRTEIKTKFDGDVHKYMDLFANDLGDFIESASSVDLMTTLGIIEKAMEPRQAQEITFDAMKLDTSARNKIPTSCSLWVGARTLPVTVTMQNVDFQSISDIYLRRKRKDLNLKEIRMHTELETVFKYPVLCEKRTNDAYFTVELLDNTSDQSKSVDAVSKADEGSQTPISVVETLDAAEKMNFADRRIMRVEQLFRSWGSMMMDEWATSLYVSRQARYITRSTVAKQCLSIYYAQYGDLNASIVQDRRDLLQNYTNFKEDYDNFEKYENIHLRNQLGFIHEGLLKFDTALHDIIQIILKEMLNLQRHCGEIRRMTLDRCDAATNGLRGSIEHSCELLLDSFNVAVANIHFEKLKLQEERWFHNYAAVSTDISNTKDNFMQAKENMEKEVSGFIVGKIEGDRDRNKHLLEVFATESTTLFDTMNNNKIASAGRRHTSEIEWQKQLQQTIKDCEKCRNAARRLPAIEAESLEEVAHLLRDGRSAAKETVITGKQACDEIIYSIELPRRSHKDNLDGMCKDTRKIWNETRNALVPVADKFVNELNAELTKLKSRCLETINKYVEAECVHLQKCANKERKDIIKSFRKHFSNFDLHENELFVNFNNQIQATVNEFNRVWGPTRPYHLTQYIKDLQSMPLLFQRQLREQLFEETNCANTDDDAILSRCELADLMTNALDASTAPGLEIPKMYVAEREEQMGMIKQLTLEVGDDINRPQVAAVIDVLIRGIEIEGKVVDGYKSLQKSSESKGEIMSEDLEGFMQKFGADAQEGAAEFAQSLKEKIHVRGAEVAALLDAAVNHILADNSRLNVETSTVLKEISAWEVDQLALIDETFNTVKDDLLSPVWPERDTSNDEEDPVKKKERETAENARKAKELIAMMEAQKFTESGDTVLDIRELEKGWLECLTISGKVFFFNTTTQQSVWNRPPELPPPVQTEKDFDYEENSRNKAFDTPRDDDGEEKIVGVGAIGARSHKEQFGGKETFDKTDVVASIQAIADDKSMFSVDNAILNFEKTAKFAAASASAQKEIQAAREEEYASIAKMKPPEIKFGEFNVEVKDTEEDKATTGAETVKSADLFTLDARSIASKATISQAVPGPVISMNMESTEDETTKDQYVPTVMTEPAVLQDSMNTWDKMKTSLEDTLGIDNKEGDAQELQPAPAPTRDATSDWIPVETEDGHIYYYNEGTGESSWTLPESQEDINANDAEHVTPRVDTQDAINQGPESPPSFLVSPERIPKAPIDKKAAAAAKGTTVDTSKRFTPLGSSSNLLDYPSSVEETDGPIGLNEDSLDGSLVGANVLNDPTEQMPPKYSYELDPTPGVSFPAPGNAQSSSINFNIDYGEVDDVSNVEYPQIVDVNDVPTAPSDIRAPAPAPAEVFEGNEVVDALLETNVVSVPETDIGEDVNLQTETTPVATVDPNVSAASMVSFPSSAMLLEKNAIEEAQDEADDIAEMSNFFRSCSLGKTTAKKAAQNAVKNDLTTVKKLTKVWAKGVLNDPNATTERLCKLLCIDNDDFEEIEPELRRLAEEGDVLKKVASQSQLTANATALARASSTSNLTHKTSYSTVNEHTSLEQRSITSAVSQSSQPYAQSSQNTTNDVYMESSYADVLPEQDQEEGEYVTFPGGWVECYSEDGQPYYYNEITKESSWEPPVFAQDTAEPSGGGGVLYEGDAGSLDSSSSSLQKQTKNDINIKDFMPPLDVGIALERRIHGLEKHLGLEHVDYEYTEPERAPEDYREIWTADPSPSVIKYVDNQTNKSRVKLMADIAEWTELVNNVKSKISEHRKKFLIDRESLFTKATAQVDDKLTAFVENTKYLQRVLKKELMELSAQQKDLRRLLSDDKAGMLLAEKLSYILEALDKLKTTANTRYDLAVKMIDKVPEEWITVTAELNRIGDMFDSSIFNALEQVRVACAHSITIFNYEGSKLAVDRQKDQLDRLRASVSPELRYYTGDEWADGNRPEEDCVLALIVSQIEMEAAMQEEYDKIVAATKAQAFDLQTFTLEFQAQQTLGMQQPGEWFDEHRETMKKHAVALEVTLERIRERVDKGYESLKSQLAALDFDAEQLAEEELAAIDPADEESENGRGRGRGSLLDPELYDA